MSAHPRVLVVSAFVPPRIGGVESFCRWLSDALPAEVAFLSCDGPGVASRWRVPCHSIAGWPMTLPAPSVRRRVAEAVAWSDAVLIQNSMHPICAMAAREARRGGRPARTVVHALVGSSTAPVLRPLARAYSRVLARRSLADAPPVTFAHVVAESLERTLGHACPAGEFPVPPRPIRPAMAPPPPGAPLDVLFAGRFAWEKAPDDAVVACGALGDRVRLTMMGDGPMTKRLRALATGGRVTFRPRGDDAAVERAMRTAHVVISPSRRDASAVTVLEALGIGCPVVATRVGDIPRHVGAGAVDALTAPPGDPGALADRLRTVAGDYGRWEGWARRRAVTLRDRHDPARAARFLMRSLALEEDRA